MKRSIKIFSILLTLLLLIGLMRPVSAFAATQEDDLTWEILSDGTISITKLKTEKAQLTIPATIDGKPVTSIDDCALEGSNLTQITIPESVISIGDRAFWSSRSLEYINVAPNNAAFCSIDGILFSKDAATLIKYPPAYSEKNYIIPESVISIGNSAFEECVLRSIAIPEGVTSIGDYAFYGCNLLTSITIPDSVTSIGNRVFPFCLELSKIEVSSDNPAFCSIDDGLFTKDASTLIKYPPRRSAENYVIPKSVTNISDYAFDSCYELTSVTIPEGVTDIGAFAFIFCFELTDITLPESLTSIGEYAFQDCKLASITIPENVTHIGYQAFQYCSDLTNIEVSSANQAFCSIDSILFTKDAATLIKYPPCKKGREYAIPEGVTRIEDRAFEMCRNLKAITVPESVTSIGQYGFSTCHKLRSIALQNGLITIEASAFSECERLKTIDIPKSVTSIGEWAFLGCENLKTITIPEGMTCIEKCLFNCCEHLESVSIPGTITSIGNSAFRDCTRLSSVTLQDGLTRIGDSAFMDCAALTAITIPESVTEISDEAFSGADKLSDIYYSGTQSQWGEIAISASANGPLFNATVHYESTGLNEPERHNPIPWILGGILFVASCCVIVWRIILAKKRKSKSSPIAMNE